MVFSSPIFLFLFLPVVMTAYLLLPGLRLKNFWLLLASLVFYSWGEPLFLFLLLVSTMMNYYLGLWVDGSENPSRRKFAVGLAVALNIGLLAFFKYANFAIHSLNSVMGFAQMPPVSFPHIALPIGISFFTFHALSYVVDIYRRKSRAAKNPCDTALYIFLFPQLIAGPILRWSDIAPQLIQRVLTGEGFAEGVRRFVMGFAKKMIVANVVAFPADKIFALPADQLTAPLAWFGALCYTLQIYFDFSAYSDMAIGLGKMFGFKFLENFNYPYISLSIREFWRRWHMSLSGWFRDYLYIPMGGNHVSTGRNYFNLITVFFLCGLWHGASWTFVIWGLYHGIFLVIERTRFGIFLDSLWRPLRHGYTLLAVVCGWVLFRADTFSQALEFFKFMSGLGHATQIGQPLARYVNSELLWSIALGVIFSMPTWPWLKGQFTKIPEMVPEMIRPAIYIFGFTAEILLIGVLFLISAAWLAGGTYNPFIYYRF
jgi:alginate O-acetyltransferase complex protein AlgI